MIEFNGIYRGIVVYNIDPDTNGTEDHKYNGYGRCKIFIPGVYPDEYQKRENYNKLPWAEPAMSIFGGGWTNERNGDLNSETGWCSVPHMSKSVEDGAQVFVFFEAGDVNKPVYFAVAQSGPGWFSEHPNQHVFKTDNVTVRIDEQPDHPDSTCKFDTFNDRNNDNSINDGTKKDVKTRIDIQVLAEEMNAVNVIISGDVNMKIKGDWYVDHEGNKHEYHKGETYIKHDGNTYIEENGVTIFKHKGDYSQNIEGTYNENITVNYNQEIGADSNVLIKNRSDVVIGSDNNNVIQGNFSQSIMGKTFVSVGESYSLGIGEYWNVTALGQTEFNLGENCYFNVEDNIELTSTRGNIALKTDGKFEITDPEGNITEEGYKNLGTKGNITLISTFGNIGINTIESKAWADLEQETCVIPWNPSYLNKLAYLSNILGDVSTEMLVKGLTVPTDLTSFMQFLQTAALYDGFPTFLPCKMIMQNPSIKAPVPSTWLRDFRSIDEDWNKVTNTKYWKLISKVVGNIDIKSWNGDITVQTKGTLGNGGNINLFAKNKYGGLPGYKVGNVNILADTPFRVFTDPRDLFLDTHLVGKVMGKFAWFSHAADPEENLMPPAITVKPLQPVQQLLQLLGVPFEFGFTTEKSMGGGCMKCITDVITQTAFDLQLFSIVPYLITKNLFLAQPEYHKFNTAAKSIIEEEEVPGGSVSILKKQSNGFGHAVDKYKLDEIYGSVDYPFGSVIINGVGSYDLHVGKNATFTADTSNWNFGVTTTIDTGWFNPSEGLNPLDILFGEMIVAMPGQVGQPTIKKREVNYYNSFDDKIFGEYRSVYDGQLKTGVYSIPQVKNGIFGSEKTTYTLDIPYEEEHLIELKQLRSTIYDVELQPFIIDKNMYLNFVNVQAVNALADDIEQEDPDNIDPDDPNEDPADTGEDVPEEEGIHEKFERKGKNYDTFFETSGMDFNAFYIKLGNEDWCWITSGMNKLCPLKQQMPNTANAISMILSVVAALIKLIPALGAVVGEAVQQFAKLLPEWRMPDYSDFYTNVDYIFREYNRTDYSVYLPIKNYNECGIIAWPLSSQIMSGKPLLYDITTIGLPNIATIADSMISVGTLIDPIGCLTKLVTEQLPEAVGSTELNTTIGIGGLPKIAKDFIKPVLGEVDEILSANVGLFKNLKIGTTVNLLNSEFDKKALFGRITAQLPLPPEVKLSLSGETYVLKCGIVSEAMILPLLDAEITLDILDETLAATIGGPLPPRSDLVICGKELWNIPRGGAGFLGSGIIKAILDLFF